MKISESFSTVNKSKNNYPHFGVRFIPEGVLKRDILITNDFSLHNNNPLSHMQDSLNPSIGEPPVWVYSDSPDEYKFYGARLNGEIKYKSVPKQKIGEVLAIIQPKIREMRKPIEDCILECRKEFENLEKFPPDKQIKLLVDRLKKVNTIVGGNEIDFNQTLDAARASGKDYLKNLKMTIEHLIR